jgi:DNA-binding SARP family transcriptional activator/tetratricopeptide (TPR) repeat protein
VQFNVLGALEVLDSEGRPVEVGGTQPRAVLAMLLLATDRVVPADTIIDRLWPENPPGSATGTLQSYISRLRRALDPKSTGDADTSDRRGLAWEARGYRLHLGGTDVVDFLRFEELADRGRDLLAGDDPRRARDVLAEALALWRGPALAEFSDYSWAHGAASRLDERRLRTFEDRIRADLLLGRHELVIGELTNLVAQNPLHEGVRELLAVALYRSGRQAEALRAIDDLRRQLVDSLGVDPSHRIRQVETQILDHDPALAAPATVELGGQSARPQLSRDQLERVSRHIEGVTATELVGRDAERSALAEALDAGLTGFTQWVVIEGEPGIGKTRLLEHLAHEANGRGYQVLWGRCYESGAPPAFWLWLSALRGLVDETDPLPTPTQELIDRLLSPAGDLQHATPVDSGRFQLFEAIYLLLQRAAGRQPLMLALDDVQWADLASLELVEFVAGSLVGARVVIACTVRQFELARNDAVVRALAHISRRPFARRIQLDGLGAADSAELARVAVGGQLPPEVIDAIHRRSEGNPFFVGELARLLVADEGLTADEQVRRAAVPAGVRDVVHRRLARLPPPTIDLLQVAATIGRETSLGLLSRAAGVTLDQSIDDLDPAFVDRLVIEATEGHGSIRFSHALVREVVLDDMSVLRRSRLHLRVADALEARRDCDAEILAEHLWQASALGVEQRAAVASERAAEVALQRFAYETAATLLERAFQLRAELPPDRADPAAELDALSRLIQVRRALHGFERARVDTPIERAKELARATNREGVLTTMLWTEWAGACTSCDFELAHELTLELRELAADSDHPVVRATGDSSWGILCWHLGRIDEAVASLDRAIAEFDAAAERPPTAPLADGMLENQVLTRCFHSFVHTLAGDPVTAASPLVARENDPYEELVIGVFESLRAVVAGDLELARKTVAKARAIEAGDSFALFGAGALSVDGCVKASTGDAREGMQLIERGAQHYGSHGVRTFLPFYMSIGAQGLATSGDLPDARRLLEKAQTTLAATGELWQQPFVMCAEARVLHASDEDRSGAAARVLGDAYAVAVAQGALGAAAYVARVAAELDLALT